MRRALIAVLAVVLTAARAQEAFGQCSISSFEMNGVVTLCADGGDAWQWNGPNGFTSDAMCINATANGTYTLRMFDGLAGTWSEPCSQIVGTPVVPPTCAIAGPDSVCGSAVVEWCAPRGPDLRLERAVWIRRDDSVRDPVDARLLHALGRRPLERSDGRALQPDTVRSGLRCHRSAAAAAARTAGPDEVPRPGSLVAFQLRQAHGAPRRGFFALVAERVDQLGRVVVQRPAGRAVRTAHAPASWPPVPFGAPSVRRRAREPGRAPDGRDGPLGPRGRTLERHGARGHPGNRRGDDAAGVGDRHRGESGRDGRGHGPRSRAARGVPPHPSPGARDQHGLAAQRLFHRARWCDADDDDEDFDDFLSDGQPTLISGGGSSPFLGGNRMRWSLSTALGDVSWTSWT